LNIKKQEMFKTIPGYSNYLISSLGQVISKKYGKTGTARELKQTTNRHGYKMVALYGGNFGRKLLTVHRLVALSFVPLIDSKCVVNHIDGDKQNNYFSNLEWCTMSENTKHSYDVIKTQSYDRLSKIGKEAANKLKKFSQDDILNMKHEHCDLKKSYREIARKYKCGKTVVERILTGVTYKIA